MTLALKIKGERFNDFDYQQEVYINVNIANSQPNPGSVPKT